MAIQKVIYHYCSIKSFISIISSAEIWLSNAYKMNDYLENKWINQYVNKNLEEIDKEKYKVFVEMLLGMLEINNYVPYLACFSKSNDVLSQWRAYSEDGTGVCIGVETKEMGIEEKIPTLAATTKLALGYFNVIYDSFTQEKIVKEIFKNALSLINKSNDNIDNAVIDCLGAIKKLSIVFKNQSFAEEQEVRIIHTPLITSDKENNTKIMASLSDMKFRYSKSNIISYFIYKFSDIKEKLISEIVLGPKCKLDEYDLSAFLSINGYKNTKINRSSASYQ